MYLRVIILLALYQYNISFEYDEVKLIDEANMEENILKIGLEEMTTRSTTITNGLESKLLEAITSKSTTITITTVQTVLVITQSTSHQNTNSTESTTSIINTIGSNVKMIIAYMVSSGALAVIFGGSGSYIGARMYRHRQKAKKNNIKNDQSSSSDAKSQETHLIAL